MKGMIACDPCNFLRRGPAGRTRRGALAAGLAFLLSLPVGAADSPWLYGIHWFGPESNNADVSAMTGGKPIWMLETVITQEGAGFWGPEGQLARLQNAVAQGHTAIARVQPVWGKAWPFPTDRSPSVAQFLDQATHTAELYRDVCHVWHLGNEMNLYIEWGGLQLQPEDYIEAAVQFSDRIRAAESSLGPQIVLVGPLSPGPIIQGVRWMSSTEYLTRMCQAINDGGYQDRFQGFAMHAYADPATDAVDQCLYQFERDPGAGYQDQAGILDAHGFGKYPVYITEWNRRVNDPNGPAEHVSARFLHRAFAGLDAWNRGGGHPVVCACWFVYHDWGGWEDYSIRSLKDDDTPDRDVWHAFQHACGQDYPAGAVAKAPASLELK